jgi:hypothetical protein
MHSLAITGFILAFICGIVGMIISIVARGQIKASGGTLGGKGFTTAGIIVGIAMTVTQILYGIAMAAGA